MSVQPSLEHLLHDVHAAGGDFELLLREAIARQVPVQDVLGHLEFDFYPELAWYGGRLILSLEYGDEAWVDVLSRVLGGDEQAQEVLGKTTGWMSEFSIAQLRDQARARDELDRGVTKGGDPEDLRAAVEFARTCLSETTVESALRQVLSDWPLGGIAQLAWLPAEMQRTLLPKRGGWPELLDQAEAEVGPELAVSWIARVIGLSVVEALPDRSYLVLAAALRAPLGHSMAIPIARVSGRVDPNLWLDVAYEVDYPASQALLVLLDLGVSIGNSTIQMSSAGWDDAQIFSALRENAIGPSRALEVLRKAGWNAAELVRVMRDEGLLEPEIRELLKELGLPASIVELLQCTQLSRRQ